MDVLFGPSCTDYCIQVIFPSKRKIVPLHSRWSHYYHHPQSYNRCSHISPSLMYIQLTPRSPVKKIIQRRKKTSPSSSISSNNDTSLHAECSKREMLWTCLQLVETFSDIVELKCLMTARGVMEILLGVPLNSYMENLSGKAVFLPENVLVVSATNALLQIIHPQSDESIMLD